MDDVDRLVAIKELLVIAAQMAGDVKTDFLTAQKLQKEIADIWRKTITLRDSILANERKGGLR